MSKILISVHGSPRKSTQVHAALRESSLYFVLQLQGDLAMAESAEVRAKANYNKELSQLHFAEGSLLERTRIVLDVR